MLRRQERNFTSSGYAIVEEQVFENERYLPLFKWTSRMLTDPKRYSLSSGGAGSSESFPTFDLARGWEWEGPWTIDKTQNVEPSGGWAYSTDFSDMTWPPKKGSEKKALFTTTRQRRWVRRRVKAVHQERASLASPLSFMMHPGLGFLVWECPGRCVSWKHFAVAFILAQGQLYSASSASHRWRTLASLEHTCLFLGLKVFTFQLEEWYSKQSSYRL